MITLIARSSIKEVWGLVAVVTRDLDKRDASWRCCVDTLRRDAMAYNRHFRLVSSTI